MNYKKSLALAMVSTLTLTSSSLVFAESDLSSEMSKMVDASSTIKYGPNKGQRYVLGDDMIRESLSKFISNIKIKKISNDRLKCLPEFCIEGQGFSIGFYYKLANEKENIGVLEKFNKDSNKNEYYVFYTEESMIEPIMEILNKDESVSIDTSRNFWQLESQKTRMDTAIMISQASFARAKIAVLVGENSIADSLSAAGLAGDVDGPILLSAKDKLDENLLKELERLHVEQIAICSGDEVISSKVRDELTVKGFKIRDYAGKNRYETSNNIARSMKISGEYIICSGENFNDVPSISQYSYERKLPLLLTRYDKLPIEIDKRLKKGDKCLLVGGALTISPEVVKVLEKKGIINTRLAGKNRFDTSKVILDNLYKGTTSRLAITDKDPIIGIATAPMSVKYKKPLLIQRTNINGYAKDNMDKGHLAFIIK